MLILLRLQTGQMLKKLFSPNSDSPSDSVGRKVRLTVESIKAFGKMTDAIRIKEYSETKCESCGNVILPMSGKSVDELVEISKRNCNKILCVACMKKYKEENKNE